MIPELGIIRKAYSSGGGSNRNDQITYWQKVAPNARIPISEADVDAAREGLEHFSRTSAAPFNNFLEEVKGLARSDLLAALGALEEVFREDPKRLPGSWQSIPAAFYNATIAENPQQYRDKILIPTVEQGIRLAFQYEEQGNQTAAQAALRNVDNMVKHGRRFGLDLTVRL